eukprot:gnl/TRDRNA2_/TRDRNA2_96223_c1_seq1.p1 gnl/TRDRNA2_/TRDRNA2_96223_c1~~gnl/TRDRNA2_/TRDRNA2_96223_c1_seq1.p1  ORF type:complete len:625 (+),score=116.13 gnl/TRDRNA2_/TRDRNA2_96223_c1_seq1:168-2042(+)
MKNAPTAPDWYRDVRIGEHWHQPPPKALADQAQNQDTGGDGIDPKIAKAKIPPPRQRTVPKAGAIGPWNQRPPWAKQIGSSVPALPPVPTAPPGAKATALAALPPPPPPDMAALPPPPPPAGGPVGMSGTQAAYGGAPSPRAGDPTSPRANSPRAQAVALALQDAFGSKQAVASAAASMPFSKRPAISAGAVKAAPVPEKSSFTIPGLQNRPYTDQELEETFSLIDLDKHRQIDASDLRRVFHLCGDLAVSDEEINEMVRMLDHSGDHNVSIGEFRTFFQNPPAIFRNFDLRHVPEKEEPPKKLTRSKSTTGSKASRSGRRQTMSKSKSKRSSASSVTFSGDGIEDEEEDSDDESGMSDVSEDVFNDRALLPVVDDRKWAVCEILENKGTELRPDFIKFLYQRFVELDVEGAGFVSYEHFCQILDREKTPHMQEVFSVFDTDGSGELDLRHLVVGLSMFTSASTTDKLKFCFMMYDDDQQGSISRYDLADLLEATSPHLTQASRDHHVGSLYSNLALHPNARVSQEDFIKYMLVYADKVCPGGRRTPPAMREQLSLTPSAPPSPTASQTASRAITAPSSRVSHSNAGGSKAGTHKTHSVAGTHKSTRSQHSPASSTTKRSHKSR